MRVLASLAMPVVVLVAAALLVWRASVLPPSLAGIKAYAPYFVLVVGGLLCLAFNRGRALFALLALATAYIAHGWFLSKGLAGFPARTVFVAQCVFVPTILAALALLEERGIFNVHGVQRLALIGAAVTFTAWVIAAGKVVTTDWAYAPLIAGAPALSTPIAQLGLAAMAAGFVAALVLAMIDGSAIKSGFAGAIAAFALAAHFVNSAETFAIFVAAGELIITIAVLQDTFRMAFRDELTGLPSRRALNERLRALGRCYTVAMVDVDHFKNFNDTYGHDVGDQVLKMVGSHIARVGGSGKAYRFGGEEFTILFPGKQIDDTIVRLEAVRRAIADYTMTLRAPGRPQQTRSGKRRRGARPAENAVSVTISIGVAERSERLATPERVIKAADQALYRAKNKGRNQVSR